MKKIFIATAAALITVTSLAQCDDEGWYITRKPVPAAFKDLEHRKSDIRDLITDCMERSISRACHRAGVWFTNNDDPRGIDYIKRSCELGRGYSCRIAGMFYAEGMLVKKSNNTAIEWYKKGCFRKDHKSCDLMNNTPKDPKPRKKSAYEIYQSILGEE